MALCQRFLAAIAVTAWAAFPARGLNLRSRKENSTLDHGSAANLANLLSREWQGWSPGHKWKPKPYVYPLPLPKTDDYASVRVAGDSCFESKIQAAYITEETEKEKKLLAMYDVVYKTCAGGQTSLHCLTEAAFDANPATYLAHCNHAGPRPYYHESGAVCRLSKSGFEQKTKQVYAYTHLGWIMNQIVGSCERTPIACVKLITACLDARDINFCFRECVRTGNMRHALTPAAPRTKYGEAPLVPKPSGFT